MAFLISSSSVKTIDRRQLQAVTILAGGYIDVPWAHSHTLIGNFPPFQTIRPQIVSIYLSVNRQYQSNYQTIDQHYIRIYLLTTITLQLSQHIRILLISRRYIHWENNLSLNRGIGNNLTGRRVGRLLTLRRYPPLSAILLYPYIPYLHRSEISQTL